MTESERPGTPNEGVAAGGGASWSYEALAAWMAELPVRFPRAVNCKQIGSSHEGRPINLIEFGHGPKRLLAWSQMHGDEPTHTAVLVRLVEQLLGRPDAEESRAILKGVTLGLTPMLNPDGAVRGTRHNAQGIDINRDARDLATAEGRALRGLLDDFRPEFALNLHNQNHRTRLEDRAAPVAVALLAPPRDAAGTITANVEQAMRIAAVICGAVWPHCDGRVTRYDADYMPNAFGEWYQRQGVATLLIEAGGGVAGDESIVDLHCFALLAALRSLADDSYCEADPQRYASLKRSGEHRLFDLLIERASEGSARLDVGVNFPDRTLRHPDATQGEIAAIGDLAPFGGIETLSANGAVCLPGRICLAEEFTPTRAELDALAATAIRLGVTTLLIPIEPEGEATERTKNLFEAISSFPLNLALVGFPEELSANALLKLIQARVLAIVCDSADRDQCSAALAAGLPVLARDDLPKLSWPMPATAAMWLDETRRSADLVGLKDHGRVQRGRRADLVICESDSAGKLGSLRHVLVGGMEALEPRRPAGGVLLKRTLQVGGDK